MPPIRKFSITPSTIDEKHMHLKKYVKPTLLSSTERVDDSEPDFDLNSEVILPLSLEVPDTTYNKKGCEI